jgi:molybdopterin/thiamine biosynthesis adenylyltransferase
MELSDEQIERYSRQILLKELGGVGQERILAGGVLVSGAGAVPPLAALYLAAAGVGRLGLGIAGGADETVATLRGLNPDGQIEIIPPQRLSGEAIARYAVMVHTLIPGESDDGLNRAWLEATRPMIVARASGASGAVTALRAGGGAGCLSCLPWPAVSDTTAVLAAPLAGALASLQAIEALKALTGTGAPLYGRLVIVDGYAGTSAVADLPPGPTCAVCGAT